MKIVISLLAKVKPGFRFLVLIVIAALGFVLGMNGVTGDGSAWQGWVGVPIVLFVAYTFYYMDKHNTQL
jgi:hypothetical protein